MHDTRSPTVSAVVAEGLTKRFGDTAALRGVDLEVPRGSVVGLLGPNGAGKTTTIRILTTLLRPDAGRAVIDGVEVGADPHWVRSRIGLTGQFAAVDERLTARENLEHVAGLLHLDRASSRRRVAELIDRFDLGEVAQRVAGTYSGGLRRRVDIAMSLVGEPSVLFLDEPTTGLDPRSRQAMWDLIDDLTRSGTTTVLTTQYMEEADRLADHIVVIDHGRVIASGTSADLKRRVGGEHVRVVVGSELSLSRAAEALAPVGRGAPRIDRGARSVELPVAEVSTAVVSVVRALDAVGVEIVDLTIHRATLDDVFLALTGHPAGDGEGAA